MASSSGFKAGVLRSSPGSTETSTPLLNIIEARQIASTRRYPEGSILFWPGDPVLSIYVVRRGAVRISSVSEMGKVCTFGIAGPGRILGADAYLLGSPHDSIAEAIEESEVYVIAPEVFEEVLSKDQQFAGAVMRELAGVVHRLSDNIRDLSFLDVQERLKRKLVRLAQEYGCWDEKGVRIDLKITHEELGALVAANRTTITLCLNALRRQGYIWTDGRRLIILPPRHIEILDGLSAAVAAGEEDEAMEWAEKAVEEGVDPLKALDALSRGMKQVDRGYTRGENELPDVMLAAFTMKRVLPVIESRMEEAGCLSREVGRVVIGTVWGDVHDIGKTILVMLLRARGFQVIDLGVNVPAEEFVTAVQRHTPHILAMSALLTSTALHIREVIQILNQSHMRSRVRVIVGGGAVTPALAREVGADGYHATAQGGVELAWRLCVRQ